MKKIARQLTLALSLSFAPIIFAAESSAAKPATNGENLYQRHCMNCHGAERMGAMGPALLPENLSQLTPANAKTVISEGRVATQMPGFASQLSSTEIDTLSEYIYSLPAVSPSWNSDDIKAHHTVYHPSGSLPNQPVFQADLQNLFIVVELADHHASLLNGDSFEVIHRFPTRYALHGGPKYSPDGRYVYFASRDGWISKYDIYNLKVVAEVRVGINTRNLAVSEDGKYAMVANYLPRTLVLLNTDDLSLVKIIDVTNEEGTSSRVSAVYTAPPRNSFVAALKDLKEVWEIPSDGKFEIRRIKTSDYLDDFFFDQNYQHLIGASRQAGNGQVINLASGQHVTDIDIAGMPHLGSGISWIYQGKPVMATPHLKENKVTIIDMTTWQVIKRIETLGPGFFMRSHDNSPYAWVDVFFGPHKEAVHVIDKASLEIIATLKPEKGKTAAHVEFTKDGRYALLSIWDNDGAVIVYDGNTLEEIKRIPMKKPSGKYNVYNKTHYMGGTSH
jgi:mono/diheme cytochrome c family protein